MIHRKKETSKEKTSIIASVKSESKTSSENDVYILFMIIKLQNYEWRLMHIYNYSEGR